MPRLVAVRRVPHVGTTISSGSHSAKDIYPFEYATMHRMGFFSLSKPPDPDLAGPFAASETAMRLSGRLLQA